MTVNYIEGGASTNFPRGSLLEVVTAGGEPMLVLSLDSGFGFLAAHNMTQLEFSENFPHFRNIKSIDDRQALDNAFITLKPRHYQTFDGIMLRHGALLQAA